MATLFILYLILVEKPRFDQSNVVETGLTMEQCSELSGVYNAEHLALVGEQRSRYLWACGPMPVIEQLEPLIEA